MDNRMAIRKEILGMLEKDPKMLKRVIMGDKAWASYYNPLLKQETSTWNFPGEVQKKKLCQQHSLLKIMLSAPFDCQGMVNQTELPANQTINSAYYQSVLHKLRYHIGRKRSHLRDNWILHHTTMLSLTPPHPLLNSSRTSFHSSSASPILTWSHTLRFLVNSGTEKGVTP